jgi:hypothetical protein
VLGWKPKSDNPSIASVRYRCLLPLRALQEKGFPVTLFDERHSDRYRGVVFSKLYDPASQRLAEKLKSRGAKVVLDVCDNHFYNPFRLPQYDRVRADLLRMIALADVVVSSTRPLADVIVQEGSLPDRPTVIGDPIEELPRLDDEPKSGSRRESPSDAPRRNPALPRLVWYGNHGSPNAPGGMLDLLRVADTLERINRKYAFELVVLSNSRQKYHEHVASLPIRSVYREWRYDTFRSELEAAAATIIPVGLNPFTVCKSNNRLVLALHHGIPVVADSIPSYDEFGAFSFLNDWERGLEAIFERRPEVGEKTEAGMQYVNENWSLEKISDQWRQLLECVLT